jgi:Sugar efflux transporter for intercellular exchange
MGTLGVDNSFTYHTIIFTHSLSDNNLHSFTLSNISTMIMGIGNATFWLLYGIALWDFVVMVPNGMGLLLGIAQSIVCLWYPRRDPGVIPLGNGDIAMTPVDADAGAFSEASSNIPDKDDEINGGGVVG